jgi:hypothetical protein
MTPEEIAERWGESHGWQMWDRESAVECARLAQQECAQEVERLRARDFFCVYCGQVFSGSESADTLKAHVAVCPEHPLSKANAEVERLKERITVLNFTVRSREDEIRRLVRELNTAHSKERK